MRNTKKIWRDNTMPPTNYIWMRVNLRNELIGVYEWLNGHWYKININSGGCDSYSKTEVDLLLEYTEQEIVRKIIAGEYDIGNIAVDDELSFTSTNPVENRVITAELAKKLDKAEFDASAIPEENYPWI